MELVLPEAPTVVMAPRLQTVQVEPAREAQRENLENPQELCMVAVVVVELAVPPPVFLAEQAVLVEVAEGLTIVTETLPQRLVVQIPVVAVVAVVGGAVVVLVALASLLSETRDKEE